MTCLIAPEKQERLREIALRRGLFLKEVLDRGIDFVIGYDELAQKIGRVTEADREEIQSALQKLSSLGVIKIEEEGL